MLTPEKVVSVVLDDPRKKLFISLHTSAGVCNEIDNFFRGSSKTQQKRTPLIKRQRLC
jgi:hypothetical protein